MGVLAEAFINVTVDTSRLGSGLGAVQSRMGSLSDVTARLEGQMLRAFGAAAAGGLAVGLFKSVKAAGDLAETINNVQVTFGAGAAAMVDAADKMSARFGVSKRQFLDNAASVGSMGAALGMAQSDAGRFGVGIAKLAEDFASLKNINTETALAKIRAGLSGQMRPLRDYGIVVSATATKMEAYASGLAKVGEPLSEQAKVQARLNIIMRGMAPAAGDQERTMGSYVNMLKRLSGTVENLGVAVGNLLLPTMNRLTSALAGFAAGAEGAFKDPESRVAGFVNWLTRAAELAGALGNALVQAVGTAAPVISGFFSSFGVTFDNVTSLVNAFGNNVAAVFQLFALDVQEVTGQVGADFQYLAGVIGAVVEVFQNDWKGALLTMAEMTLKFLDNVGKNFRDFGASAWGWMTGGFQGNLDFKITPLTEGLGDLAARQGLKLPEREKVDLSDAKKEILDGIADATRDRLEKKKGPPLESAQDILKDPLNFQGRDDRLPKKEVKEEKSTFVGIAEFARVVQQGVGEKDKTAVRHLQKQEEANEILTAMRTQLEKIADDGVAGVGLAVA